MNTTMLTVALSIVMLGGQSPPPQQPTQIPQDQVYQAVIQEEFCSCTSPLTVAGCLELQPNCKTARHIDSLAQQLAQTGRTKDELLGILASRITGPFCATPFTISGPPIAAKGPDTAPITLLEFADFRCAHCKQAMPIVDRALKRAGSRVRFLFVPFPIGGNEDSMVAAEAFLAARAQGKEWQMYKALFDNQHSLFFDRSKQEPLMKRLIALAQKTGLDTKQFKSELHNRTHRSTLNEYRALGSRLGVHGTPSFYVNGRPFDPDPVVLTFQKRFAMELDRNKGKCQ